VATVIDGDFEWHDTKAATNIRDHKISFPEAAIALQDPNAVDIDDLLHPDRVVTLAVNPMTGVLYVVWTEGGAQRTRIISARRAEAHECNLYAQGP
jgi:uncharacterized DUF497 family protein